MEAFLVFFLTLLFIFVLGYLRKLPLFVILILGGIFCGLLAGAGPDSTFLWVASGMGSMFAGFAIAILSGVAIVRLLADQELLDVMIEGIRSKVRNTLASSGILAFVLAVPITCPVVTYAMLSPVLKRLEPEKVRANMLLYAAATCGIVSYILVFPTPVTQPLVTAFAPNAFGGVFDLVTIPVAVCLLVFVLLLWSWRGRSYRKTLPADPSPASGVVAGPDTAGPGEYPTDASGQAIPLSRHLKAWAPFIAIVASIPVGHFLLGLSHVAILQFIMLVGLVVALFLAPQEIRITSFSAGVKTAGMVLFDICAAGAIGTVMVKSGLAKSALTTLIPVLPDIVIPFIIAAILATAQGSRVVTAVVSAQVIGATALIHEINPLPMILMVAAGSCFLCHITDPFFQLIRKTTGDTTRAVLKGYTLPLACVGIVLFVVALVLVVLVFPYHEDAALAMIPQA
ncbi:MAG: GntP family permease [Methanoregula sp.]|jgi:GntP family gluconate:H+ symporter